MPDNAGNKRTARLPRPRVSEEEKEAIIFLLYCERIDCSSLIRKLLFGYARETVHYYFRVCETEKVDGLRKLLKACGEYYE